MNIYFLHKISYTLITVEDLHKIDGQEEDWSAYSNGDVVASGNSSNGEAGNHETSSGGETGPN